MFECRYALELPLRARMDPARAEAHLADGTLTIRVPFAGQPLPPQAA